VFGGEGRDTPQSLHARFCAPNIDIGRRRASGGSVLASALAASVYDGG
jgi:hypothetical protein